MGYCDDTMGLLKWDIRKTIVTLLLECDTESDTDSATFFHNVDLRTEKYVSI